MNKKDFQELIKNNIDKFVGVYIDGATIRLWYPHVVIIVRWNTGIGHKTTIKTMRGLHSDLKNQKELSKYINWALQIKTSNGK